MMVTFVPQCEKKALPRTRWVLDAFADRIGDNTWQTIITQEGLRKTTIKIGAEENIIESLTDCIFEIEHNEPCLAGENGIRGIVGRTDEL